MTCGRTASSGRRSSRPAFAASGERVRAGWAPFWRYRDLGRYGEQVDHLYRYVPPERVLVLRYPDLVDDPRSAVDRVSRFLGIRKGLVDRIPRDNARSFVPPGWRPRTLGPVVRGGARLAQFAPPHVWRRVHPSFISLLSDSGESRRPRLDGTQRARLQEAFVDDIDLLTRLTGQDFGDWLSPDSRGSYDERAATVTPISARR